MANEGIIADQIVDASTVGKNALKAIDAASFRTVIGVGTSSFDGTFSSLSGKPTTLSGYGITDAITSAAVSAGYQPIDADLTAIAALTTTTFGRSLLTQADAAAARSTLGAGTSSFDGAYSSLSGTPSTFAPSSHVHGNISNAGAIGSTANLPLITTTSGVITVGAFGTSANTFCVGNDSRLSDARTPTAHDQAWSTITSTPTTLSGYGITDALTAATAASTYLALSGGTLTGPVTFPVSTTSIANFNLPPGSATPTSPVDGDIWYMSAALNMRVSATTRIFAWRNVNNTFNSQQTFNASTASVASIRIPPGSATPSSLVNGDVWTTTVGSFWYINGASQRTLTHAPTQNTYTPASGGTATLLLSETGSNIHKVTRPTTGNITIAFSGDSANQSWLLYLETSSTGTPGTVTWPAGLTWLTNAGSPPTISTAVSKIDSVVFLRTGASTYLAWHTGQN